MGARLPRTFEFHAIRAAPQPDSFFGTPSGRAPLKLRAHEMNGGKTAIAGTTSHAKRTRTLLRAYIVGASTIHGQGVFAARDLPPNHTLMQYRGRLLTHAQADASFNENVDSGHTFLFTLNDHYVIDAGVGGNSARWINHSCDPNCQAVVLESPRGNPAGDRIVIQTIRAIQAGEELTYHYGIKLAVPHSKRLKRIWACHCGARNCTGTLLVQKRNR